MVLIEKNLTNFGVSEKKFSALENFSLKEWPVKPTTFDAVSLKPLTPENNFLTVPHRTRFVGWPPKPVLLAVTPGPVNPFTVHWRKFEFPEVNFAWKHGKNKFKYFDL